MTRCSAARVASSGLDAQLALQHRGAAVVGADGSGAVAQVGLELHQRAVADLLQRLQPDPRRAASQRPGQVARRRPAASQTSAHSSTHWCLQLGPGVEQPVVVQAGQQVAAGTPRAAASACAQGAPRRRRPPARPRRSTSKARTSTRRGRGVAPAQVLGGHPRHGLVAQRRGAGGAARGAGWSAPARRWSPARTARRCAGAVCGTPAWRTR